MKGQSEGDETVKVSFLTFYFGIFNITRLLLLIFQNYTRQHYRQGRYTPVPVQLDCQYCHISRAKLKTFISLPVQCPLQHFHNMITTLKVSERLVYPFAICTQFREEGRPTCIRHGRSHITCQVNFSFRSELFNLHFYSENVPIMHQLKQKAMSKQRYIGFGAFENIHSK